MVDQNSICYKHGDRKAAVACQRCDKPICANCMNNASVGFHCNDCAKSGSQKVYKGVQSSNRTLFTITNIILALIGLTFVWQASDPKAVNDLLLFGPSVTQGQWWRIFTSGFAHNGLMHLGFNAYALWILGSSLEPLIGKIKFSLVYLGGLLGGSLAVLLFNYTTPTLGASGAVMGLIGGYAIIMNMRGINVFQTSVGFIILLNLGLPLIIPSISLFGHLGGLLGGAAIAYIVLRGNDLDVKSKSSFTKSDGFGLGVCAAMLALAILLPPI